MCFRPFESLCQITRWWERRRHHKGEMWSVLSHASWPRPERHKAFLRMTSVHFLVSFSVPYITSFSFYFEWPFAFLVNVYSSVYSSVSDRCKAELHPLLERPAALWTRATDPGGDGFIRAGRPDRHREQPQSHHSGKPKAFFLVKMFVLCKKMFAFLFFFLWYFLL